MIQRFGPLSRAGIRERTALRAGTISTLIQELLREGKVLEAGRSNNPLGRKRVLLRLNERYRFIVGLNFDTESVVASVMDLRPKMINKITQATFLGGGVQGLVKQLLACTHEAIEDAGLKRNLILGIGIADPGPVNSQEGTSLASSTIEFWREVPLQRTFEDEFRVPCVLENDSRAKAVAERVLGAGEMAANMIHIDYGRGIGAGVITAGKMLRGDVGIAGEFGHIHMLAENGPACKCGSFGCLEAIAGVGALEARCRKAVLEGGSSQALALADNDPDKITGWTVLRAASLGDKTCGTIVEELEKYLALGIANLVNLFNPSIITLDPRLELAGQGLLEQIVRIVKRRALAHSTAKLKFCFGRLGSEAGVLGAGLLVLEKAFELPESQLPETPYRFHAP